MGISKVSVFLISLTVIVGIGFVGYFSDFFNKNVITGFVSSSGAVSTSVTVNAFIDFTIDNASLGFGSIDSGSSSATTVDLYLTIGDTTNTDYNITLKANNSVFYPIASGFKVENMSFNSSNITSVTAFTTIDQIVFDNQSDPSPTRTHIIEHNLSIPAGQVANLYFVGIDIIVSDDPDL